AYKMAEKSRYYNKKVRLEPMNPYERRIIHAALQGEKDIITYSEGEEPYRKVIIETK
ncbi:MAG TPA: protein jag, partial [Clostridiales bacterium]|nr:protein jag [Clostridiales bacterium]